MRSAGAAALRAAVPVLPLGTAPAPPRCGSSGPGELSRTGAGMRCPRGRPRPPLEAAGLRRSVRTGRARGAGPQRCPYDTEVPTRGWALRGTVASHPRGFGCLSGVLASPGVGTRALPAWHPWVCGVCLSPRRHRGEWAAWARRWHRTRDSVRPFLRGALFGQGLHRAPSAVLWGERCLGSVGTQ